LELVDAGVADVLVDAGVPPVDGAAADLAAARAHAAGAGRVRHGAPGHAALAHDELVLHVPGQAVLGDQPAHAIGRPAIAVDHQVAAILERHQLGRIAPDIGPFRRRPGEAVILGDDHHHVLGVAARL